MWYPRLQSRVGLNRSEVPGVSPKPVQHKMKNFLQTELNGEIRAYPWQHTTSAVSEIAISPVLLSRARFRKNNGP
jgi:hypothetical protein